MSWNWLITNFLAALLLPPLNMLVIGAIGFWQLKMRPRLGRGLIAVSLEHDTKPSRSTHGEPKRCLSRLDNRAQGRTV